MPTLQAKPARVQPQAVGERVAMIIPKQGKTTVVGNGISYHYVNGAQRMTVRDQRRRAVAMAKIRDLDGHLILLTKRIMFVKDTPPVVAVPGLGDGSCFQMSGVPHRLFCALKE